MKKLSFKTFLMFSINYIVGFGFILTVDSVIKIGAWGSLVIVLGAGIALIVAMAFIKGVQTYGENGGSYIFAKHAFGNKLAFFQGWNEYIQSPIIGAAYPMFLYELLKTIDPNHDTTYRIVSLVFFVLVISLTLLGLKKSTRLILIAAFLKWILLLLTIGAAIYLFATNSTWTKNLNTGNVSIGIFVGTLMSFFYSYGGIEGIAVMTQNVKNGKKNAYKIIFITYLFATVFYLIVFFILFGASKVTSGNKLEQILKMTFGASGIILFIFAIVFNNFAFIPSAMNIYTGLLATMSVHGDLPLWFSKKNRYGAYQNALYFDLLLKISLMIIFVLLPIWLGSGLSFINIINIWSINIFIQYSLTIFTILILAKQKKLTISVFERLVFILGIIIMTMALIVYLIPPTIGVHYSNQLNANNSWKLKLIQLSTYITCIGVGFLLFQNKALKSRH